MNEFIEWGALANVLIVGTLVGAGLPALFALGVRILAAPGARDDAGEVSTVRLVGAWACFAIVIAAVIGAIYFLASGGH
ncbi:hypothetical protein [Demequina sp. NBRC 110056]|uniref:hypothetical protein n=1 Tax=Demequina sp. NBRC 110056 TaxID=1570345 RepID=UPI000A062405|nr:hypothetical protein [Demequina sp. NBRC 110056]